MVTNERFGNPSANSNIYFVTLKIAICGRKLSAVNIRVGHDGDRLGACGLASVLVKHFHRFIVELTDGIATMLYELQFVYYVMFLRSFSQ